MRRIYKKNFFFGIEIHAELDNTKLFCNCKFLKNPPMKGTIIKRTYRPVPNYENVTDETSIFEHSKSKDKYNFFHFNHNCLLEVDEAPPSILNGVSLSKSILISNLLKSKTTEEIIFMRKHIINGSIPSGFQRTGLVAVNGGVGKLKISSIKLEEDACNKMRIKDQEIYGTNRLGLPLIEISSEPQKIPVEEFIGLIKNLGEILLNEGFIEKGKIRQDFNMGIPALGWRIEIKGINSLTGIKNCFEFEVNRWNKLYSTIKDIINHGEKLQDIYYIQKNKLVDTVKITPRAAIIEDFFDVMNSFDEINILERNEKEIKIQRNPQSTFFLEFYKNRLKDFLDLKNIFYETRKGSVSGETSFLRPISTINKIYLETDLLPYPIKEYQDIIKKVENKRRNLLKNIKELNIEGVDEPIRLIELYQENIDLFNEINEEKTFWGKFFSRREKYLQNTPLVKESLAWIAKKVDKRLFEKFFVRFLAKPKFFKLIRDKNKEITFENFREMENIFNTITD